MKIGLLSAQFGLALACVRGPSRLSDKDFPEHIISRKGKWVPIAHSSAPSTVAISQGTQHSTTIAYTSSWSTMATRAVSKSFSFEFFGSGGSVSKTVTGSTSQDISSSYSNTFSMQKSITITQGPFPAGTVWQWQFTITDDCNGHSVSKGNDIVSTPSDPEMPCCLPGYFVDATVAHGKCLAGADGTIYNACDGLLFGQNLVEDAKPVALEPAALLV